ncbi:MAG: hypothetical protein HZY79_10280 [Rhodoblastus sp.]|nr:MAG: hypothetical protein HZY79_10280 [Rhodoblastus sp.]
MTFKLVSVSGKCGARCPQVISAEGEIDRGSAEEFIAFLRGAVGSDRLRNVVFINSPGGNVIGAMKLGTVFRRAGSAVVVAQAREGQGMAQDATFLSAECMSACVYAIMGGKTRVVPPQSRVGVHRTSSFRIRGKDPAASQPGYQSIPTPESLLRALSDYTQRMGVSREVLTVAQAAPANSIRVLTRSEVARWRLGKERFERVERA